MTLPASDYGQLWFAARKLVALLERSLDRRLRADLGIGMAQFMVLSAVQVQSGTFNQQGVAEALGTSGATVSRQLDAGARAGYITVSVSAVSRRENVVELTPAGTELVAKGDGLLLAETARLLADVPAEEVAAVLRGVTTMVGAVAQAGDPGRAGG